MLILFSLSASTLFAESSLRLMFYNIYRYPYHSPESREQLLKEINDEIKPDLLMVCELVDEYGADMILYNSFAYLEGIYKRADFIYAPSAGHDPLHQMVFYNAEKITLLSQQAHPTEIRDINQYTFCLNTPSLEQGDTTYLEVFVTHLKSSDGNVNRWKRKDMVDTFFNVVNGLPADRHVVFAGDMNFYTAHLEPGFNKIVSPNNNVIMKDPLDAYGDWHANEDYSAIHTQSTRVSTQGFGSGGAGGGLDDRFDFIFLSENLFDNSYFYYQEDSYEAVGNNGNCFKNRIDALECDGEYSQSLRESLYYMSDHLPIALNLRLVDEWIGLIEEDVGRVDINDEKSPFLYGNIADNFLTLSNPSEGNPWEWKIYNVLGQEVLTGALAAQSVKQINVSFLQKGFYYLTFRNNQGQKTFKIVKQ